MAEVLRLASSELAMQTSSGSVEVDGARPSFGLVHVASHQTALRP